MLRYFTLAALVFAGAAILAAETEDEVRKSIPVQSATRLGLDVDFGSIDVSAGGSGTIEVEAIFRGNPPSRAEFDRMLKDFSLDVRRQGSGVFIRGTFKDGWKQTGVLGHLDHGICHDGKCLEYSRWLKSVEFRVKVPSAFSADLHTRGGSVKVGDLTGEVNAQTAGGSLEFGSIGGAVTGETSGGSITLIASKGRSVLHTSGGSIRIEDASGDVDAHTSGGSIQISRTTGRVVAHTSGGSINIGHAANGVEASTSGGGINVAMPSSGAFQLDASTSGGRVHSEFPVMGVVNDSDRHTLRGMVNGGGPLLHLTTSGGSINIRRAS
jgi:DUF4097 and DUF4098 domain-containing protein YvlB